MTAFASLCMKRYLAGLSVFAVFCSSAELRGAAVTAEANEDNGFSASSAGDLPIGNVVRLGYFDVPDSVISQRSAEPPSFLDSQFHEFGRARIGDNGTVAGHFRRSIDNLQSNAQGFANKQIYLWVFNSTDTSDQNFLSTATEQGVFYFDMTVAGGQEWRFRDTSEPSNTSFIELTDLTTADSGTLASGARVVIGLFPYGASSSTGARNFGLVQIPEPGSAGLVLASVVGIAFRRRRSG